MDDVYKTRIKVGAFELEAEGPVAVVQDQVKRFMELIARIPVEDIKPVTAPPDNPAPQAPATTTVPPNGSKTDSLLTAITKMENRVVSLTARPQGEENALLLLLYGQKVLRQNDAVTGSEINDGIQATGGFSIPRPDRILDKLARDGDVITIGERRSKTYRLTNAGLAKARQAASDLIATVA